MSRTGIHRQSSLSRSPSPSREGQPPSHTAASNTIPDVALATPGDGLFSSLFKSWSSFQVAPGLENTGSVARDHLANERTWLAYVRTSLSIASAGVALVQLFTISTAVTIPTKQLRKFVRPLGGATVILGWLTLVIGTWRYFRVQTSLQGNKFPPARVFVGFLSVVLGSIVAVTFAVLLEIARKS